MKKKKKIEARRTSIRGSTSNSRLKGSGRELCHLQKRVCVDVCVKMGVNT